jgi:hypothetical protein
MHRIKSFLSALALVLLAVPLYGAAYIKFDGIDGESRAGGFDKWIEIQSVQFEGGSSHGATRSGTPHRASLTVTTSPSMLQACASGQKFAKVIVDADGQRHTLQNVSLSGCPAPTTTKLRPSTVVVIRIDFASCAEHPQAAGHVKVFSGVDVQVGGLTPSPVDVKLVKTSLRGNTATATFVTEYYRQYLGRPADPAGRAVSKIDALSVKQKATAGGGYVFGDVVISSVVEGAEGTTMTFTFGSMTGSAADYQRLGQN